jgi:hypothetical protein
MDKYWKNASGCYDPTLASVIEKENSAEKANNKARNKQVHDTIQEIKNILKERDLELIERIKLKDKRTNKKYK